MLHYSDSVPCKAGYYWERRVRGVRIIEVTDVHLRSNFLKCWKARKAECLAAADAEQRVQLLTLDDAQWRIEFAGPIAEPSN